jgi:hypothetical protein
VKGAHGRQGVVGVEAEIAREMVARPRRDADEGTIVLGGDCRDGAEGAVARGDPESGGPARRGGGRDLAGVLTAAQQPRLDAEPPRLGGQLLGCRAVPP